MGYVKTLYIDGLKRFEHFKIEFNEHLSILVGENEAGKSTILEAIRIVLNQLYWNADKSVLQDLFNLENVRAFQNNPNVATLPRIIIEVGKGLREVGQTVANAFRTFADKPEVDYSQKEQKHPITQAVLAPMKAVKNVLVSMELHLDASIDKLDNLAMNVQIDKEKRMENTKSEEQNVPDRAEAEPERVNAEIVYAPMVAEAHEYQYNADAFEARGVDEVKQEAAYNNIMIDRFDCRSLYLKEIKEHVSAISRKVDNVE